MTNSAISFNNDAVECTNRGKHKNAVTCLNKALLACTSNRSLPHEPHLCESDDTGQDSSQTRANGSQGAGYDEGMNVFSEPVKIPPSAIENCENADVLIKATIFYNMGIVYARLQDNPEALANFQIARGQIAEASSMSRQRNGNSDDNAIFTGPSVLAILLNIGKTQYVDGDFEESLDSYHTALETARSLHDREHTDVAKCLNCLGVVRLQLYQEPEDCQKTIDYLVEALGIYKNLDDKNGVATVMNNIGRVMIMKDELEKALEIYERVYTIRKELVGTDNLDVAATLFNIGETFHLLGRVDEALEMYLKFLPVATKHLHEDHPDVVCVLKIIADAFSEQNEYDRAFEFYHKALNCAKRAYGECHPEVASILNRLGNHQYENRFFQEALICYKEGLKVEQMVYERNDPNLLITIFNIARIHQNEGELEESLQMYLQGLAIQRASGDEFSLEIAGTLCSIGLLYDHLGELNSALRYYEESLQIRRELLGNGHLTVSSTLNSIGLVYFHHGDTEKALENFEECLRIRNGNEDAKGKDIATILYNIATVYMESDRGREAIPYFEECLRFEREEGRKSGTITCLKRLAQINTELNEYDSALNYYDDALQICLQNSMIEQNHEQVATILGLIGNLYLEKNDATNATNTIARAIRANRVAGLPDHANLNFDKKILDIISKKLEAEE